MSSLHFIPEDYGNEGTPVKDTRRTQDGQLAGLPTSAYPITATRSTCGGRIRTENRPQYGRRHVPAGGTS
jgi:hypothetical protein